MLATHPKISQAAIIGVPDDKWGEVGMGFIVPAGEEDITEGEILDFLKGKVARYKIPARYHFLKELPYTATMKVRKAELKERYAKV